MELELLQTIWFGLVTILFIGYAVMDGFDLGVGMLHLFARSEEEKRLTMNSVGPFWDGNEVWLIAAGGAVFAAFAPVYAAIWSGFYVALILLLVALLARAVAFDYRAKVERARWRQFFDWCFGAGSGLIALLLGVAFGNILHGIPIDARGEFAGTFWTLLNPYAVLIGILTVLLFTLHGALWLALKCEGDLQARMILTAHRMWIVVTAVYMIASVITVVTNRGLFTDVDGNMFWWISLLAVIFAMAFIPVLIVKRRLLLSFIASSIMIAGMIGVAAASLFPMLVPSTIDPAQSLTAFAHSSSRYTLMVIFWIALIGMPIAILWKVILYVSFRGKTVLTKDSY
ncbi:MAG: cytochrome d ubiquinol oxidase subunit II [Ignavibacteria bacterium]|nr:cytochrome d ubiquinol oxidase subunit II [Ignavibacteria bacterium]